METEQAQKTAVIEEQQRRIRQRKEQKLQQEHDQDISSASFQAELNQQRQVWQFQKEKDEYEDRRKQQLDGYSSKAAEDTSAELFRRERYLGQMGYDRTIHSAARTHLEQRYSVGYDAYQDGYKLADKDRDADNADTGDGDNDDNNKERPSFNPCG
jgi:hypothetical protein